MKKSKTFYVVMLATLTFSGTLTFNKTSTAESEENQTDLTIASKVKKPQLKVESHVSISPTNKKNYVSVQLLSNRFVFASGMSIILREQVKIEEFTGREQGNGTVTVEAYRIRAPRDDKIPIWNPTPIWKFSATGRGGDFLFESGCHNWDNDVYELRQAYCCDISERKVYYNLKDGKELFSTTTPALTILDENNEYRYIGFDDGVGAEKPPAMKTDKTIIGLLQYAGDGIKTRKLAVIGDPKNEALYMGFYEYRDQEFNVTIKGKRIPITNNRIISTKKQSFSFADGMVLSVKLICRCGIDESLKIPIKNDNFVLEKAILSSGIRIKQLP